MSSPVRFEALEYGADGAVSRVEMAFDGDAEDGWSIERNGAAWLSLGPGYRLLRTAECGVCSTDLDRRYLPFPLPQIIGHELIATDEAGRRHVVEINASHHARGVDDGCAFCAAGLPTHCPDRLVLGIHALPGGFGPWVLAPRGAVLPVPDGVASSTAVLVEPFAAALHAVSTISPRDGDEIAVLGPRRLGMLVIAALAAHREATGTRFDILALARRPAMLELAEKLGADRLIDVDRNASTEPLADVVIDTTGAPAGLSLALRCARREVHLKSTHGQPAAGLDQTTALVVDELSIARLDDGAGALRLGRDDSARAALEQLEAASGVSTLPRANAVVVTSARQIDEVVRPDPEREVSLVRPRGVILLDPDEPEVRSSPSELVRAVADRGLRLSTSRCGDFAAALDLMQAAPSLRDLGERLITHRFDADELAAAFATARTPQCVKAVVTHSR